jgi:hypothetical protein
VNYVDAGYSIALSALFLYGLGLGLRRRRWERALKATEPVEPAAEEARSAAPS